MNPGYVYILTNDAMPGIVKIGRTAREVELRASELWQTGVPQPFHVHSRQQTIDCCELETMMHGTLREARVNSAREFFRIDPVAAREHLRRWALIQAHRIVMQNFNGFTVIPYERWVSEQAIEGLAAALGQPDRMVADALAEVSASELTPAMHRVLAKGKAVLE